VKKIHIVGTVGVPACYGGFETLVENLIDYNGKDITVYCSAKSYARQERKAQYKNAKLIYIPVKANGLHSILYDILSMLTAVLKRADVILILGVSGCLFLPIVKLLSRARIVTNIDGLEWRRNKWNKYAKWFLKISEAVAVKYSDAIISDNGAIADYVRSEYNVESHVIAYGGDHVEASLNPNTDQGYALSLCRIEPENNVEMILSAFSQCSKKIKFVGNWDNSEFGRNLKLKYSAYSNIEILDPIYDINSLSVLRSGCSFYIHGHSAGGTNPSLVEMMHFGKTIFCYDCAYNRASTENKAAFFSDAGQLLTMLNSDLNIENGDSMLAIAQDKYIWKKISEQYFTLLT
jgi:glycosyltransferase involved in cell wall biosynthesis